MPLCSLGRNFEEELFGKGYSEAEFEGEEFWAELVLNGIGGRTIAEAKRNLSHREYIYWWQYRKRRGSLNFGLRFEEVLAGLKFMYAKAEGFQVEDEYDFLPHHDAPEISFEEAMQQYGGE